MNKQDDLTSLYRDASDELPSAKMDQLILEAAEKALDEPKSNIIKGRFAIRRWQTPVSIAAAALLTVSFVGSYTPWKKNEFETESFAPQISEEVSVYEEVLESEVVYVSDDVVKEITLSRAIPKNLATHQSAIMPMKQKSVQAPESNSFSDSSELLPSVDVLTTEEDTQNVIVTGSRIERLSEFKLKIKSESLVQAQRQQTKRRTISIDNWLTTIEDKLQAGKTSEANNDQLKLLDRYPLVTFSRQQKQRFEAILTELKVLF